MYRYTYEDIAERYIDTVYRLALARVKSAAYAEDITQDVFLKLLERRQGFESEEHLKAWLLRVTVNCTKDLFKSSWLRNMDQLDENIAADSPNDSGLYTSLMKLPQKYRTVIHLHYYEGYSIEEIASIIKARVGTVKSQLSRARQLLRNILDEEVN